MRIYKKHLICSICGEKAFVLMETPFTYLFKCSCGELQELTKEAINFLKEGVN